MFESSITRVSTKECHHDFGATLDITLGDVISIYADGAGFISTLGLVDDRCVTNFNDGNLQF